MKFDRCTRPSRSNFFFHSSRIIGVAYPKHFDEFEIRSRSMASDARDAYATRCCYRRRERTIVTIAVHIYASIRRSRHRRQMNGMTLPVRNAGHQYFIFGSSLEPARNVPEGQTLFCRSRGSESLLHPFVGISFEFFNRSPPLFPRIPYFIATIHIYPWR